MKKLWGVSMFTDPRGMKVRVPGTRLVPEFHARRGGGVGSGKRKPPPVPPTKRRGADTRGPRARARGDTHRWHSPGCRVSSSLLRARTVSSCSAQLKTSRSRWHCRVLRGEDKGEFRASRQPERRATLPLPPPRRFPTAGRCQKRDLSKMPSAPGHRDCRDSFRTML